MTSLFEKYQRTFSDREFLRLLTEAVFILVISLIVNFFASRFATTHAGNAVTDIILDNIPVFGVHRIFVYGPLLLTIFAGALVIYEPKQAPFVGKGLALFVLIRSLFIILTHLGPFPDQLTIDYSSNIIRAFTAGGDLFFSAHTGIPFLFALIYWHDYFLRTVFIITSVFFGVIVLMGHLHYSIDVLSAFFITYTIFEMAKFFFQKDRRLFLES